LPATIVNGGVDSCWKWKDFRLSRTRDLDLGSGHTAYCRVSLTEPMPTDGRTDGRTYILKPTLLGRVDVKSYISTQTLITYSGQTIFLVVLAVMLLWRHYT